MGSSSASLLDTISSPLGSTAPSQADDLTSHFTEKQKPKTPRSN